MQRITRPPNEEFLGEAAKAGRIVRPGKIMILALAVGIIAITVFALSLSSSDGPAEPIVSTPASTAANGN